MKIRKIIMILAASFMLTNICACQKSEKDRIDSQESSSVTADSEEASKAQKLTNHMSDKERSSVNVGDLTVFEHEQMSIPSDGVYLEIWTPEYYREYWSNYLKNHPYDKFTTEEEIQRIIESAPNEDQIHAVFVDGHQILTQLPSLDYDGGELTYTVYPYITTITDGESIHFYDEDGNELTEEEVDALEDPANRKILTFKDFEECKSQIRKDIEYLVKSESIEQDEAEAEYERTICAWEALINKTYKTVCMGTTESNFDKSSPVWEIDHAATEEIAEFVREISIYDEELDTNFIVHVTLPPEFDPEKTYPSYVLTDGVWRFGNHPAMRKTMEEGKASDVLLVSIGYDYSIDGMDDQNRIKFFSDKRDKFLDFITDNLMPYLGEQYNIDFGNSTIYGHSLGGTFTHYAVFNSDKYENQPFGNYIIGSPAFWSPGFLPYSNASEYKTEYGYFDRNSALDKRLFICAGENEDPVYEEYYGENDSTLEGVDNLMKRLSDYGFTNVECKIYPDSEHYQFIPEMLVETLEKFYPA